MANIKEYKIVINGLEESINAVDSLNKQLDALEKRINALQSKSVNIGVSSTSSSGSRSSNASALSAEEATQREINKLKAEGERLDAKIAATQDEIYKRVDATKQLYKETVADQKSIAAQERLVADAYSNTMQGMKAKLADIKSVINVTDLGDSDKIKQMTKEANELASKLKEMEAAYGQYGRNVGNYANGVAEGLQKVRINVGGVVREFDSAREASRTLNNELKSMAVNGQQDTEAFKQLQQVVMELDSNIADAKKPMDDLMDAMEGIMAVANVGQGLRALFGVDDAEIQKSIQKLVALQNVLKGIEAINEQIQTRQGVGKWINVGSQSVDKFVAKLTGAKITMDGLTASSRGATIAVRGLSMALKSIGIGFVIAAIPEVINGLTNIAKEMASTQSKVNVLDEALASLNNKFKDRNDLLASSYLKGEISDNELLAKAYGEESDYLSQQIVLLRERAALMNEQEKGGFFSWGFMDSFTKGSGFTGERMNGSKSVESYSWLSDLIPQLKITVTNTQEVEEEFKKCQEAIHDTQDYFTKWGSGLLDWVNSLFTSVSDTERVMRGLGNTRLNEFVGSLAEANQKFKEGKISAEQFAQELGKLKGELNSSDVLRSVIANLDKYIPDEKVREAVNNIINQIIRLDDAFNMTSPEQVRHWMQVRIDAMAEGTDKIKAQIDADEKYEIAQYGKTQEQINLIHAKYNRKRQDELKKYNEQAKEKAKKQAKELEAVEKELNSLRIENMKEGLEKQLAQLEEERRQKLQAAKDNGIKVGELTIEINKLYDKKILDARKEWAYKVEQVYIDMWNKIYQLNHKNAQTNFDNQLKEIQIEYQKFKDALSNDFSDIGADYSDKEYVVQKKPKSSKKTDSTDSSDFKYKVLIEKERDYTKRLREEYATRTEDRKKYYSEIEALEIQEENKSYDITIQKLEENKNNELRALKNSYAKEDHEIESHYKNGEITLEQYNEVVKRLNEERATQEAQILSQYQTQAEQKEREHEDKIVDINQKSNNSILENYRDYMAKLANIDTSSSVKTRAGFIDIVATKKRNKELIDAYRQLGIDLEREINNLKTKLESKDLTEKQRNEIQKLINQYRQLQQQIGMTITDIDNDTENSVKKFMGELNQYLQEVMNSFQTIMQAVWQAQDNAFDEEQDELDKWNEKLDKALDKQQAIVEKHKDAIDSIEDELGSARGDRRQHLIDQLNAEMDAERAAQKEKQKIQKEQEKAQKKQDALDLKRKKAQYHRDMLQAIVNGAMAVTYAAMNSWPVPAVPMMALAGATTAAQIAIMASNKPYAKGGLLEGKSHAEGGIPIPGTGIEVEGKEYVIRKKSTAPNIDILDYINKSERKLTLDDFIDFYSSGKFKKNISSISPRSKFADGGTMPLLPSNIELDDRLINAMEDYSNRPVVVEVKEILNKAESIRAVQTLAGLTPTY